jgi:hypothetical protein
MHTQYTLACILSSQLPLYSAHHHIHFDMTLLILHCCVTLHMCTVNQAGQRVYTSNLEITGSSFEATYTFVDPERAAMLANGGGVRVLTWDVVDGERVGVYN